MSSVKELRRKKRHQRIRINMYGSSLRPRLVIQRSLNNLRAQVMDDLEGKVVFSLSTLDKKIKQELKVTGNIKAAEAFGELFAQKAKEKGITKIIFDRAGYLYHGRIKAFAEALRKGGLEF